MFSRAGYLTTDGLDTKLVLILYIKTQLLKCMNVGIAVFETFF